ncbi:MAG: hypothetical protein ABIC82_03335 [bacterium]
MNNQTQNHKIIDSTLDAVHKIQETLYEKSKGLNWQEKIKQMNEAVKNYRKLETKYR